MEGNSQPGLAKWSATATKVQLQLFLVQQLDFKTLHTNTIFFGHTLQQTETRHAVNENIIQEGRQIMV